MRAIQIAVVIVSAIVSTGRQAGAACDPSGIDAAGIAAARNAVATSCPCASAPSASEYKLCAKGVARTALANPGCLKHVTRCAAKSICGRPGAVTCCRVSASGRARCKIARDASTCRPPRDGTACAGEAESCCDACTPAGCAGSTTTTSTTTPPTNLSGAWTLSGSVTSSSCSIPPPRFESQLVVQQDGSALHATGSFASYTGTVSPSGLTLQQTALPQVVGCPGGFYDGFLNMVGGPVEGDGSIAIEQRFFLFPPVMFPGCPPCSVRWSGRMTRTAP